MDATPVVSQYRVDKHRKSVLQDVDAAVCSLLGLGPEQIVSIAHRTITFTVEADGSVSCHDSGKGQAPELNLDAFDRVIHAADRALEQDLYADFGLVVGACDLAIDAALLAGDHVLASEYIRRSPVMDIDHVLNVLPKAGSLLSGADLLKLNSRGLTKFGRESPELVAAAADVELAAYLEVHGVNPIWRVYHAVDFEGLPGSLSTLGPFFGSQKAFTENLNKERSYFADFAKIGSPPPILRNHHEAFARFNGGLHVTPWMRMPWLAHLAAMDEISTILRAAENRARQDAGIPLIGEGWVSEMLLLSRVREALPEYEVIHHGRPGWLGRQHLDIWIPALSVGLEYQGEQHSQPIEHFGGQEALAVRRELDARKAMLCNTNGCTLIEVMPGYEWTDVRSTLMSLAGSH